MSESPPLNVAVLTSLSGVLTAGIHSAELEAKRSREQLDALLYSKSLVDESLKVLGAGDPFTAMAQTTLFPSGSMALPICQQFLSTGPGAARNSISQQIQTTIQAGVSAFVSATATELRSPLDSLAQKLAVHDVEILSLEDRLSRRLSTYSEHLVTILKGALNSFRDAGNSLRYVNTGNGLRELLREFLAVPAPDKAVRLAPWFVPDPTSASGVTRRHRLTYAIFGTLDQERFPAAFVKQADDVATALLDDIGEMSKYTHVTETILGKDRSDAAPLFASLMQRFLLLVSAIECAKTLVEQDIQAELWTYLDTLFTEEFFDELDTLSSHTRPQGAVDIEVDNVSFDEEWIHFTGTGTVECDLQWGSDGDVRRGDGAEGSASFPFTFTGKAPIGDLSKVEVDRDSVSIDTSSFYGTDDED